MYEENLSLFPILFWLLGVVVGRPRFGITMPLTIFYFLATITSNPSVKNTETSGLRLWTSLKHKMKLMRLLVLIVISGN